MTAVKTGEFVGGATASPRPEPHKTYKVLLVTPRTIMERPSTGRDKLLRALSDCGPVIGSLETVTVPNVFNAANVTGKLAAAAVGLAWDLLRGRSASLQSLLFRSREGEAAVAEAVRRFRPDVIYFDSIRLTHLAPRGEDRPCVLVDLDDLLSRRIQTYARAGIKPGVGELGRSIPKFIVALLEQPLISKVYLALEKALTRCAELRAAREADALVLTSPAEARALARFVRRYSNYVPLVASHPLAVALKPPIPRAPPRRLTFVGTSTLPQNQDGILWCRKAAAENDDLPIEVYGSAERPPARGEPRFVGYVDDLARAYAPDAVPTCMTRVRGGIKTKVLEAWAYGAPIVATPQGLEGIDVKGYPLTAAWNASTAEVLAMMTPQAMEEAVTLGREYLRTNYDAENVAARWRSVFSRAMARFEIRRQSRASRAFG